jgi:hypothetical protein
MKKKFIYLFLALFILALDVAAQMLETVDMSTITTGYSTYLTGINNKGYVTGYANTGSNVGFIITPNGRRLIVDPAVLGATDTKVESINNNDVPVAVVTVHNGSTPSIYKCYIDTLNDTIGSLVQVQNIGQPSSVAFDISDNNDISGWFQASTRFLWVKHDSIIPTGNIPFESDRVETTTQYNTMAGGVNNANKVAGFYIDGTNYEPLVYDNITELFQFMAITNKCKLWDINNNDWVAGEYQLNNGVWMAFVADVSTNNFTQFTSLKTLFADSSIQSVANAINDNGDVAGSYYHPTLNRWVGFIYHPNTPEYRIPGFNYAQNTWTMLNSNTGNNPVWNPSYWQGSNYLSQDPYANNGLPLLNSSQLTQYSISSFPDSMSPSWKGFGYEIDSLGIGTSTNSWVQQYYTYFGKAAFLSKYMPLASPQFTGYCYGFSYTTLLRHFNDALFSNWFGMPSNSNLPQIANTDDVAVRAIERTQHKQFDKPELLKYMPNHHTEVTLWEGLYRLKNTYRLPMSESNPRAVYLKQTTNGNHGYHSILPYKIRTPRKLPFDYPTMQYDTMFIYDSNFPGDSLQYFTVRSIEYAAPLDSAVDTAYPNLVYLAFNEASVKEMYEVEHTAFKSTSSSNDLPYLTFSPGHNAYFTITGSGSSQVSYDQTGYTDNATDFTPLQNKAEGSPMPGAYSLDTALSVTMTTSNYTGPSMAWNQNNANRSMSISRTATVSETDHATIKNRFISYGNPNNVTKYLNCSYLETAPDMQQGVNIMAGNICAAQGDSIVTENTSPFVYKITKVTGTANCTYDLTIFAAYNGDSVKEFHSQVNLDANTSHTIDPYFNGTNGTQIAVIVDNGLDGNTDDTLFVAGWPIGMENVIAKNGIKIYPNPVQDQLTVEFSAGGNYSFLVTDIVGKAVYNEAVSASGKTQIPMSQYPAGVYLIQVMDSKGTVLLKDKIIKQ